MVFFTITKKRYSVEFVWIILIIRSLVFRISVIAVRFIFVENCNKNRKQFQLKFVCYYIIPEIIFIGNNFLYIL